MFPSHKMIGAIAALSLLQGRELRALLDEREAQAAQTNAVADVPEPVAESRQVRRARERREAKARS